MINRIVYLFLFLLVISAEISAATVKDGIRLFNAKEFHQANTIFESLSKDGNVRALFWLGVTQFRLGEQFKAGSTLLEASEKGDPWAMHLMVPSYNGYCDYLGWDCDEAWMDKAISGWDKLAAQGDGKAMYALLLWGDKPWWSSIPIINEKRYGKLVEKAVHAGGYEAASFHTGIPLDKNLRIKLLKYGVKNGYAPSMLDLYAIASKDSLLHINAISLLKKALSLGYGGGDLVYSLEKKLPSLKTVEDIKNVTVEDRKLMEETYFYSLINLSFHGRDYFGATKLVKDSQGERVSVALFSPERKIIIEEKAKEFLKKVKPNMFFDESTSVHGLLGS